MRKLLILSLCFLFLFLTSTQVFPQTIMPTPTAVDYVLPYPGILPDHPLYPLKMLRDRILLFLTRDKQKRIELKILYADKRLASAQTLIENNKQQLAEQTISKAEKYLLAAVSDAEQLLNKGVSLDPSVTDRLLASSVKHGEIIESIIAHASGEERQGLELSFSLNQEIRQKAASLKMNQTQIE